mgnify:CR=1 FL=1
MSLSIEVTTDLSQATKDIDDFSKKSRIALTQLSLVAQDLPYGFIGIQNNVPALVKSNLVALVDNPVMATSSKSDSSTFHIFLISIKQSCMEEYAWCFTCRVLSDL